MILQQLITGVSIGSVYALLAVGYALVFSVFNFSNFGFGPVMMLGAFGALFAIERTHMASVSYTHLGNYTHGKSDDGNYPPLLTQNRMGIANFCFGWAVCNAQFF